MQFLTHDFREAEERKEEGYCRYIERAKLIDENDTRE